MTGDLQDQVEERKETLVLKGRRDAGESGYPGFKGQKEELGGQGITGIKGEKGDTGSTAPQGEIHDIEGGCHEEQRRDMDSLWFCRCKGR